MKVRILANVKHNGEDLEVHEVYDITDEQQAAALISAGVAEAVDQAKPANPEPETKKKPFEPKPNYVAEAVPTRPLAANEVDATPVTPPAKEPNDFTQDDVATSNAADEEVGKPQA